MLFSVTKVLSLFVILMPSVACAADQEQEPDAKPSIRGSQHFRPNPRAGMEPWKTQRLPPPQEQQLERQLASRGGVPEIKKACAYRDAESACEAAKILGFQCGRNGIFEKGAGNPFGNHWGGLYAYGCDSKRYAGIAYYNSGHAPNNIPIKGQQQANRICNYSPGMERARPEGEIVYLDSPFVERHSARGCSHNPSWTGVNPNAFKRLFQDDLSQDEPVYFADYDTWAHAKFAFLQLNPNAVVCRLRVDDSVLCQLTTIHEAYKYPHVNLLSIGLKDVVVRMRGKYIECWYRPEMYFYNLHSRPIWDTLCRVMHDYYGEDRLVFTAPTSITSESKFG